MRRSVIAVTIACLALPIAVGASDDPAFFPSVELVCEPLNNLNCSQNTEPDVKVDAEGSAYVSAIVGVPGGTNFWRRTAGETFFRYVGMPEWMDRVTSRGVALGGGDTALAIAPERNAQGTFNVYVASLYAAGVTLATSRDNGDHWQLNVLSAPITADRQWLVADGAERLYLAYVDFSRGGLAVVARSEDGGRTFLPPIPVYEPEDQARGLFLRSRWGSIVIDRRDGTLYWPFANADTVAEAVPAAIPQNPAGVQRHVLRMAVSRDGGLTWRNRVVHRNPPDRRMDAVFPWATVDAAGNVYALWSDTAAVWLSRSSDGGETWLAPVRVSAEPVRAAVLPAAIGGRDGTLDIGFIGTETASVDDEAAVWNVYFVQTLNALDPEPAFTQVVASDQPVHVGSVCLRGLSCNLPAPAGQPGDRALAEILTVELDTDGMAILAAPYDFRDGRAQGDTQSLLIKQAAGERAFDSTAPILPIDPEPR